MKKLKENEKQIIKNNLETGMSSEYIINLLGAWLPSHKQAIKNYIKELQETLIAKTNKGKKS